MMWAFPKVLFLTMMMMISTNRGVHGFSPSIMASHREEVFRTSVRPHLHMFKHPASEYSYSDLLMGLERLVGEKQINKKTSPNGKYVLYNYAKIVSVKWQDEPLMTLARGLVIDPAKEKIAALPFPKFFNHNEYPPAQGYVGDDYQIVSTEVKYDGSLGIAFWDEYDNNWSMITRGSFISPQSRWGIDRLLSSSPSIGQVSKANTYLFEIICPESKVVVIYDTDQLRLLSGYNNESYEQLDRSTIDDIAESLGTPIAEQSDFLTISEIKERLETMSGFEQEGYIVQFQNGERRKLKSNNYISLHRGMLDLTKRRIHAIMKSSENPMEAITVFADSQPEEHYTKIIGWANEIMSDYENLTTALQNDFDATSAMDNRTLGLTIKNPGDFTFHLPELCRSLLFVKRKGSDVTERLWDFCI